MVRQAFSIATAAVFLVIGAACLQAQVSAEMGAWQALMLSPFGALPPRVVSNDTINARPSEITLRYGRWEFEKDDAGHDNVGLTASHRFARLRTDVALTGAYLWIQCGGCSRWSMAGVDVQSTPFRRTVGSVRTRPLTGSLGVQLSGGLAHSSDARPLTARSAALSAPLGLGLALRSGYVDLAVIPGFGYGRIAGEDQVQSGTRPALGAAVAFRRRSGFGAELGFRKVFVVGGPSQLGVGLLWGLGSREQAQR